MQRLLIIIIAALVPTANGCVASAQGRLGGEGPTTMPANDQAPQPAAHGESGPAGDEDEHWFSPEDYLVSEKPYEGKPRRYIKMGKMMTPPADGTKAEARFLLANGKELWTAHYWRSRMASDGDVSVGAMVFCPQGSGRPPESKPAARRANWLLGAVTDVSDLYKGVVAVGHRDCEVRALRVPIR